MGIDGDTNSSLIQAGTEQDWGPQGVLYYAWYEMLPAVSIELGAVQPGDRVTVDIVKDVPGTWSITVDDSTEGSVVDGLGRLQRPRNERRMDRGGAYRRRHGQRGATGRLRQRAFLGHGRPGHGHREGRGFARLHGQAGLEQRRPVVPGPL